MGFERRPCYIGLVLEKHDMGDCFCHRDSWWRVKELLPHVHLLQSLNASRDWLDSIQFINSKTNQIDRKKKPNLEHESWSLNNSILNSHVRRKLKAKRGELAAVLGR
jgi:hypothetical protein